MLNLLHLHGKSFWKTSLREFFTREQENRWQYFVKLSKLRVRFKLIFSTPHNRIFHLFDVIFFNNTLQRDYRIEKHSYKKIELLNTFRLLIKVQLFCFRENHFYADCICIYIFLVFRKESPWRPFTNTRASQQPSTSCCKRVN